MMYENPELSREAIDYVFTHHPRTFKDMVKASIICDMRLGGVSYQDIGIEVDLTPSRCREYVEKVRRRYGAYLRRLNRNGKTRLFDKIKEMSVTELAEFLANNDAIIVRKSDSYVCDKCKKEHGNKCHCDEGECLTAGWSDADSVREWLLQEVEE